MGDILPIFLASWERAWRENGLDSRYLEAGTPREEVLNTLTIELGSAPPPDLVEWFIWHNGSIDEWVAAPSGHALLGLGEAVLARRHNVKVNESFGHDPGAAKYNERWLPLTRDGEREFVFDVETGGVHAFNWWEPDTPVLVVPELSSLIANWTGLLNLGLYKWNVSLHAWVAEEDLIPKEVRRRKMVW